MFDFKMRHEETASVDPGTIYDVIVLGGGPAGLAAGMYAARAGLSTLVLEKGVVGGQIAATAFIENCPGCIEGSGSDFISYMQKQATKFGAKIATANVEEVDLRADPKLIVTLEHGRILARAVIIATGASSQKLGIPGEKEFRGKGVSYCSTCDGPFYKNKTVAVIGGGDAAVEEANYLTRFASKVILIHRRDQLRATKVIQDHALANRRLEVRLNTVVDEMLGDQMVRSLTIRNIKTNEKSELHIDGVFVYIGTSPNTELFEGQVNLSPNGYIITNEKMETNIPGVFAAGDVRETPLRQVITAAADGAVAATYADRYLNGEECAA